MAEVVIREAPAEVVQQADKILESHHEHLLTARILWLFSNAKSTSQGEVLLGKGKKLTPEMRFLSSGCESVADGYDFVITVAERQWAGLLATQRAALLDHLLCFCDRKERVNRRTGATTYSWAVRGPDVREFTEIVERHGLWRPSIKKFAQALPRQIELPAEQTLDVRLPAGRVTTVDENHVVVNTQLEDYTGLPVVPDGGARDSAASAPSIEALASCEHGTPSSESCAECVADARERVDNGQPVRPGEWTPKSHEEVLADLDRRDSALDAQQSKSVTNDSEDVHDRETQKQAFSMGDSSMPDSWRQRIGIGKGLFGRAAQQP